MSLVLLRHLTSWGRKRHMRRTSSNCFYLATKTHYGMFLLPEITLPIPVRERMSRALNNCCHAGIINTCTICASSMSCQCCQLMRHSCNNPIHIHQYYSKEKADMQVSASNHCKGTILLPSFHGRQKVRSMNNISFAMLKTKTFFSMLLR